MLLELTRRRLVVFDEVRDGYELVHDALVEPLREFLDRQRTDYSKSEFLAIVRRVLAGERIGDQLLENLALFCLRAGVNPEWLEKTALTVEKTPFFYSDLIRHACQKTCRFYGVGWPMYVKSPGRSPISTPRLSSNMRRRTKIRGFALLRLAYFPASDWIGTSSNVFGLGSTPMRPMMDKTKSRRQNTHRPEVSERRWRRC